MINLVYYKFEDIIRERFIKRLMLEFVKGIIIRYVRYILKFINENFI